MAFLSNEQLASEAERLGLDLSGLKYQEKQKAVAAALRAEVGENVAEAEPEHVEQHQEHAQVQEQPAAGPQRRKRYTDIYVGPSVSADEDMLSGEDLMEKMRGRETVLSPEYHHGINQTLGFEENLGDEVRYEQVDYLDEFERGNPVLQDESEKFSSYRIAGTTGKQVTATTGLPLEMARISFIPDQDIVPRITWRGRTGYIFKHPRLSNIQSLLIQCGEWETYKDRFKDEPAVWHANGVLACDINLVHSLFDRIERDAQRRDKLGY